MDCGEDATMTLRYVERERMFHFSVDVKVEYDRVNVQALCEVFLIVIAKERRRFMLDIRTREGLALVTRKPNSTLSNNNYGGNKVS